MLKSISFLFFMLLLLSFSTAAPQDSIQLYQGEQVDSVVNDDFLKFSYRQLIIPTVLITYGFVALDNDRLIRLNENIRNAIGNSNGNHLRIDNVTQYLPAASVYGLNLLGVKGKNSFRDRTVIFACSHILMTLSVEGLKHTTNMKRPGGLSRSSFPSGHTATAFMSAAFLWQEYKDVSVWYGIGGYAVAVGTGYLRIFNNRHWFSDVVAGAGIGILSTKVSYWIYPTIRQWLFKDKQKQRMDGAILPFYNGQQLGLSLVLRH